MPGCPGHRPQPTPEGGTWPSEGAFDVSRRSGEVHPVMDDRRRRRHLGSRPRAGPDRLAGYQITVERCSHRPRRKRRIRRRQAGSSRRGLRPRGVSTIHLRRPGQRAARPGPRQHPPRRPGGQSSRRTGQRPVSGSSDSPIPAAPSARGLPGPGARRRPATRAPQTPDRAARRAAPSAGSLLPALSSLAPMLLFYGVYTSVYAFVFLGR